jgi:glycosyltransferase involved in cell wall biosynthesis
MTSSDDITVLLMDANRYPTNPYMTLLTEALRDTTAEVRTPVIPLFFPLTRTAFRNRDADVMQLDWVYEYYTIKLTGYDPVDDAISLLRAVTFLFDLVLVSLFGIALVQTVHNKRHHEGKFRRTERVVREALFWIGDAAIVKCNAAAESIAAAYTVPDVDRLDVVSDGNYISAYENRVSETEARDDLSIAEDAFVYLFFGLIREYKGVPDLLEAYAALDEPNTELWIVGKPNSEPLADEISALAERAGDVETVLEFVPEERIQHYLNAADVLVLPYRDILNSGSAYLGLSYGLPVVAPAIGCLPETLPPENDFLYVPTDGDALQRELERVLEHPDLDSVGRANYQHAVEQDWESTAASLLDVYRRVLGPSSG